MRLTVAYFLRFKKHAHFVLVNGGALLITSMIREQIPQFQHCRLGVIQIVPVKHDRANFVVRSSEKDRKLGSEFEAHRACFRKFCLGHEKINKVAQTGFLGTGS